MLKIILDTNILLVSISKKSRLYWIFKGIIEGKYTLYVTTDILAEYAEVIEREMNFDSAENTLNTLLNLPNVIMVNYYYRFNLLADQDDNKFVDTAIATGADFIVSHDKDFKVLADVEFPKVTVLDTEEFKKLLFNI